MAADTETWPAVAWPVVMIDGEVSLFPDYGDLQSALEPWMAWEEDIAFYDSHGRKLRSGVALGSVTVMVNPYDESSHADELLPVLREYLRGTESESRVDSGPLRAVIEQLERRR